MRALYLVSVWLHVLAAVTWLGGMAFVALVVVPWLRSSTGKVNAGALMAETGARFRTVGWTCFGVVLVTGTYNLWFRGVRLHDFVDPQWLASSFGQTLLAKLLVFVAVVSLSAVHDFWIGPHATAVIAKDPSGPEAARLRRRASWRGRRNMLLALALVALAVVLVRGPP